MTNKIKTNAFIKRYEQYIDKYKTPEKITSRTKFLKPYKKWLQSLYPNKKLLEIVYIKINKLTEEDIKCPVCKIRYKKYYTITKGYNLTCSQSCSTTLINSQRDKSVYEKQKESIKKTYKENKEIIICKRNKTKKLNGTKSESEIAREAYKNLDQKKKDAIKNAPIFDRLNNPEKTKKIYLNIAKKLLNDIDENGNNHYDRVHLKKLNDIDENGNNWYDRVHLKKLNDIDENGNNWYKRRDLRNYENGIWTNPNDMKDFQLYSYLCRKYTSKQSIHLLENFDKRGHANKGKYHLDHKYSIFQGFKDYIPPWIIGDISNLEMIIGRNNLCKNRKCSISKENLINNFYK